MVHQTQHWHSRRRRRSRRCRCFKRIEAGRIPVWFEYQPKSWKTNDGKATGYEGHRIAQESRRPSHERSVSSGDPEAAVGFVHKLHQRRASREGAARGVHLVQKDEGGASPEENDQEDE